MGETEGVGPNLHQLRKLQENLAKLSGEHSVPASELFHPAFMRRHTRYDSFDSMLDASPIPLPSSRNLEAITGEDWDDFVHRSTEFENWQDMKKAAAMEWARRQLARDPVADPDVLPGPGHSGASEPAQQPTVFLCHSSDDDEFVNRLATDLLRNGVRVFNDEWEIRPGDSLIDKINEGLAGCDVFVAVLSRSSLRSKWVREELNAATVRRIQEKARIIPVMLERCQPPPLLSHLVWVDFADYEAGLQNLLDGIFRPDRRPPLGTPRTITPVEPPLISGLTSEDEAVLTFVVRNSEDSLDAAFTGEELTSHLNLTPDQINDSVEMLKDQGYLDTRDWMGTVPYLFGHAYATFYGFRAARHVLSYDPDQDIREVAAAVVSLGHADGPQIHEVTSLTPARISRAIRYLEHEGVLRPVRAIGTAPYDFAYATATPQLRRYAARFQG